MKTKIFVIAFIAIMILLGVSNGKIIEIFNVMKANETEETTTDDNIYNSEKIDERVAMIIELVKNRDKKGISRIISYPLEREYPIPPVKNKKDFIERFDEIFDSRLIKKISNADPKNIWVSWRGVFIMEKFESRNNLLGFECFDDNYNIKYIECSDKEELKKNRLIEAEKKDLHASLKTLLYPVALMETSTHLIRVDCIKKNNNGKNVYRYASWEKGSSISDNPDLILINEISDGILYYFAHGDLHYVFEIPKWGNGGHIEYFRIYKNFEIDELEWITGDLISEQGSHSEDESDIKLIFWSEERELRKRKQYYCIGNMIFFRQFIV